MNNVDPSRPIVVALGGNALLRPGDRGTWAEQARRASEVAQALAGLRAPGGLVLTHGNGPQVGAHLLRSDLLRDQMPPTPLDISVAATQGELGLVLSLGLNAAMRALDQTRRAVTLLTTVAVSPEDPAFQHPTKFVGRFYDEETARRCALDFGWRVAHDADRGWRRVVASPTPHAVLEIDTIRRLVSDGSVVIAGGGGGVAVIERAGRTVGVEAVVDKDLTAALLATGIGASRLIILTAVDQVWLGYGQPDARPLGRVHRQEMARWLAEGHFPEGSMGPKIQAALDFLDAGGEEVCITSPEALAALDADGPATRITR